MTWWWQRRETGRRRQTRVQEGQRQPEARGRTGAKTTGYCTKLTANPNPSLIRDGKYDHTETGCRGIVSAPSGKWLAGRLAAASSAGGAPLGSRLTENISVAAIAASGGIPDESEGGAP